MPFSSRKILTNIVKIHQLYMRIFFKNFTESYKKLIEKSGKLLSKSNFAQLQLKHKNS